MGNPASALEVENYDSQMKKQLGGKKQTASQRLAEAASKEASQPQVKENEVATGSTINKTSQQVLEEQEKIAAAASGAVKKDEPKDELLEELDLISKPKEESKTKGKDFNFRELEKKRIEAETRAAELEKTISTSASRIAELEALVEKTAFEKSPKFQSIYLAPKQEAETALVDFAKEYSDSDTVVKEALSLRGKARLTFIDEEFGSGSAAAEFVRLLNEYESKDRSLQKALENHKETKEKIKYEEVRDESKEKEKILENFDKARDFITPKLSLYRTKEGDEEHNSKVAERVEAARKIITGEASQEDIMLVPFLAVTCREYIKIANDLNKELQKYKARVKEDIGTEVSMNRGSNVEGSRISGKPKGALSTMRDAARSL